MCYFCPAVLAIRLIVKIGDNVPMPFEDIYHLEAVIDIAEEDHIVFGVCPTFYTHGSVAICGPFSRKSAMSRERYLIA
jgi:hypothetical protein